MRGGRVAAVFAATSAGTDLADLAEAGGLRLRRLHGRACEATLVNTGGGIVGGDRLCIDILARRGAAVTFTTAAAEKCYRAAGAGATVETRLTVEAEGVLHWLPQETILFDGARVERSLTLEMAGSAAFVGMEMIVFGRLAHGETMREGLLRDAWRIRRDGRLVFADATLIDAPIDEKLDRAGLGGGARAVALLVAVGGGPASALDEMRARTEVFAGDVAVGVSLRGEVLVARLTSATPDRLRMAVAAAIKALRATPPRSWS